MTEPEDRNVEDRDLVERLISGLKQQRDEIALKIHLGKEDAKEEWEKVQDKFQQLNDGFDPVKDAVAESAGSVFESLKLVAGEVKSGFDRIRDAIIDDDEESEESKES